MFVRPVEKNGWKSPLLKGNEGSKTGSAECSKVEFGRFSLNLVDIGVGDRVVTKM